MWITGYKEKGAKIAFPPPANLFKLMFSKVTAAGPPACLTVDPTSVSTTPYDYIAEDVSD